MSLDRVDYTLESGSKVEVEKSALPDGASTEDKQDDIISELQDIDSNQTITRKTTADGESVRVQDSASVSLLGEILLTLKKIETHLSFGSGEEL